MMSMVPSEMIVPPVHGPGWIAAAEKHVEDLFGREFRWKNKKPLFYDWIEE